MTMKPFYQTLKIKFFQISFVTTLLMGLCLFPACEDFFETVVEIDIPELDSLLVVNSIFEPNVEFQVRVYQSKGILDDSYESKPIANATVELFDAEGVSMGVMQNWGGGPGYSYWPLESPKYAHEYTIQVSAPGFETVTASSHVPPFVEILSAAIVDSFYFDPLESGSAAEKTALSIVFEDAPNVKNFYYLNIYSYSQNGYDSWVGGQCFTTFDPIFESEAEFLEVDPEEGQPEFCDGMALFTDNLFDGETKDLRVYISRDFLEHSTHLYVEIGNVSEDFYYYKRSAKLQSKIGDNPFAEPVRVYNNIEGGFGIFGGYGVSLFEIQ